MERKLKVLMISAEVHPLAKVGGLADVVASLPRALAELGHEVRIAVPFYRLVRERNVKIEEPKALQEIRVPVGKSIEKGKVEVTRLPGTSIQVLLIENDTYFDRDGIYGDPTTGKPYDDNPHRFIFFSRASLEAVKMLEWKPDIIHCHDHQTGFVPAWIRCEPRIDGMFEESAVVFTIHNLAYQGVYPREIAYIAGLDEHLLSPMGPVEFYGKVNMMKAAVSIADAITTVSPTYAKEIQTPEFGYGLEGVLRARSKDLYGILNGADYTVWNPEKDKFLPAKYNQKDLTGKHRVREYLVSKLSLSVDHGTPLIGMVSRLVDQKGLDILIPVFDDIVNLGVGVIVLGLGDKKYHDKLTELAKRYPGKVSVNLAFDEELAHLIEGGCDMFLMPSKFEPCGLNQFYSMKYGTIPIVRKTGGLADSVIDYGQPNGTGFVFESYEPQALLEAVRRAVAVFADRDAWTSLMKRAMTADFSWERSAREYDRVYRIALEKTRSHV